MSIQKTNDDLIWLAIAHVRAEVLDIFPAGSIGAHVAVFGRAPDEYKFVESVRRLLVALQLDVIGIEDIERVSVHDFRGRVSDEMYNVAESLSDAAPVGYGTFYTYGAEVES